MGRDYEALAWDQRFNTKEKEVQRRTHEKMSCDNDVSSCQDDVTGDWASERYHCLMHTAPHYINFPLYFKLFKYF